MFWLYTYSAGVDSQTVILVVDDRAGDVDTVAGADVESVGVVAALAVSIGVVDGDSTESQLLGAVDAEDLHGGVLDVDVLNLGVGQTVGVEELGLLLAAVASLAVPPAGTISVELRACGSLDGDGCSGNRDQGTFPFLVVEGGGSFEDDLCGVVSIEIQVGDCDELTVVPVFSPVRSRVVPAGTTTLLRVMVEQEVLLLMAAAAPVVPEKVQEARGVRREVPRTLASAAGAALTAAAPSRAIKPSLKA
jgi:hypothetical protein